MAYKNKKKQKAHVKALHKPIRVKKKREKKDKEWREFVNKLTPPFVPRYRD